MLIINSLIFIKTNTYSYMQNSLQRKIYNILLLLSFLSFSCKKFDPSPKPPESIDIQGVTSKFFKTTSNTSELVKRVVEDIRARNFKKEFIYSFAKTKGFAIWDKVVVLSSKKLATGVVRQVIPKTQIPLYLFQLY